MSDMVPLVDQIACVEREIGFRERFYPRWIQQGKLTQDNADQEMVRLRAVLATLKAQRIGEVFKTADGRTEAQVRREERARVLDLVKRRNSGVYVRLEAMVRAEFGE